MSFMTKNIIFDKNRLGDLFGFSLHIGNELKANKTVCLGSLDHETLTGLIFSVVLLVSSDGFDLVFFFLMNHYDPLLLLHS